MKLNLCLILVGVGGRGGSDQETKIKMSDLPVAVQKAAQAEQSKGSKLVGFVKEVEGGKTLYEVETRLSGHTRDLLFDSAGQIVEIEEEVPKAQVPAAALKALAAHGIVTKVE